MSTRAVAEARTNIALVKYWGKRDATLNLPAVGSISLTLDGLATRTEVVWDPAQPRDRFFLHHIEQSGRPLERVLKLIERVRSRGGRSASSTVRSQNNFPTASGLASSASAFAALALAAVRSCPLDLSQDELCALARCGSGSAARSLYGGFVEMHRGDRIDGSDAVARPLAEWDLRLVIGLAGEAEKSTLSTEGMSHTAETSPYYPAWIERHAADLAAARTAILRQDLEALGVVAERSCLRMHASALAADPGILYWNGATVEAFHAIRRLRQRGVGVWFTNDAGPHIKGLCAPNDAAAVATAIGQIPGIVRTIVCSPGAGATLLELET